MDIQNKKNELRATDATSPTSNAVRIDVPDEHQLNKEVELRRLISEIAREAGGARAIVGFSGGVDSSFLLWESVQALGCDGVIAVTATSATSIPVEEQAARQFAALLSVQHLIVPTGECDDPGFSNNPPDRCYVCKLIRYRSMKELADRFHPAVVLDGTQADDDPADRPGMRALAELKIRSPLREAGIGKSDVRSLLKNAGFTALAEKNAQPCLATRIPIGTPITEKALSAVQKGEAILQEVGLTTVRLRHHGSWARIVTNEEGMATLLGLKKGKAEVVSRLKALGFDYVTLDLVEYGKIPH